MFIKHQPRIRRTMDDGGNTTNLVPTEYAYVVVGDGRRAGTIKSVPFRKESHSPLLNVQNVKNGSKVMIAAEFEARGWGLLDDWYDAEKGREDDKRVFHRFMDELRGAGNTVIKPEYKRHIVPGFPNKKLPTRCVDLSEGRNPLKGVYDPDADDIIDRTAKDKTTKLSDRRKAAEASA